MNSEKIKFKNIIAIGDVHGCAEELRLLIHQLPLNAETLIVFLGDYIDRGPDSKGVIDTILELRDLYHVVTLMGNHEEMFSHFLRDPNSQQAGFFILNGGSPTLASYASDDPATEYKIPDSHKEFFSDLSLYFETKDYFFVHAGIPEGFDFSDKMKRNHRNDFLWIRGPFLNSERKWPKKIIHGHTPVKNADIRANRVNVDTGCVFGNKLSAIEFPSERVFSVVRNETSKVVHLEHVFQGVRRPKRFAGNIPLFIEHQGNILEFQTINYSQFGILMQTKSTDTPRFNNGEILLGYMEDEENRKVHFQGEIVRTEITANSASYAMKINIRQDI